MPADINTPGLAVTLAPLRGAPAWRTSFSGSGAGGGLVAGAPADQPMPIARLKDFAHGAATVTGPLSERYSLSAAGTFGSGSSYLREQLANANATNASAFAHLIFTPSPDREWRALGIVQRAESPFENWQPFLDSASTTRDTAVHLQTTLDQHPADGARWRVFGGFTQRIRENSISSSPIRLDRIIDGPVAPLVESAADVTARRIAAGARLTPSRPAGSSHRFDFGIDVDNASTSLSDNYAGAVRESVDTVPARIWTYTPGSTSDRNVLSAAGFASDRIALGTSSTLDAGVRAELVHGAADGAATSITWFSLLPHAYLRWPLSEKRAFVFGYARSANALTQNWLAFGDPAAPTATVAAAAAPTVIVSRVGPGTGGNPAFSGIDDGLKRPYTDEFIIGYEKRRSPSTRYTLTAIARREANLLGVVNTGVTAAGYSTIAGAGCWSGPGRHFGRPRAARLQPSSFQLRQGQLSRDEHGPGGRDGLCPAHEPRARVRSPVPAAWSDGVSGRRIGRQSRIRSARERPGHAGRALHQSQRAPATHAGGCSAIGRSRSSGRRCIGSPLTSPWPASPATRTGSPSRAS